MTRCLVLGLVALTAALLGGILLFLGGTSMVVSIGGGLVVGTVLLAAGRRWILALLPHRREIPRGVAEWSSELLLWCTVALAIWKMARVPLWSWDHFSMWGMGAGQLDDPAGIAGFSPSHGARPELALPLLWRFVSPESWPSTRAVVAVHAAMAVALLLLVRGSLRWLGVDSPAAQLLAAWLAASPLLWDTVFVGVADLPLALWTTLAVVVLVEAAKGPPRASWLAGCILGFLPWVKREGLPLSLSLLAAGVALFAAEPPGRERRARIRGLLLVAGVLLGSQLLLAARYLPAGPPLFSGDWPARALRRLPHSLSFLAEMAGSALGPAWLGFWAVFCLGAILAVRRRHRLSLLLTGVVLAQVVLYGAVYLCAFPDPVAHVRASFLRLMGALAPAAMLALGSAMAAVRDGSTAHLKAPSTPSPPEPPGGRCCPRANT